MPRNFAQATALKKNSSKLTRRILLGSEESERRPLLDEVKGILRRAKEEAQQTVQELRKSDGVSLPTLAVEWDLVPTANPSPSRTIEAYEGKKSEIRVTIHLGDISDDTTTMRLEGCGISHLIGISTGGSENTWQTSDGAMLAIIKTDITLLKRLLHDILIDMAMVHARSRPWSGIREQLNSQTIAALKVKFIEDTTRTMVLPYHASGHSGYFPLASFARTKSKTQAPARLDFHAYVALWTEFASFAKAAANLSLFTNRRHTAKQILESHVCSGRISKRKFENVIPKLETGHYCLYFLQRKARNKNKINAICSFFRISRRRYRTQLWVIHQRDEHKKLASQLLYEGYITVYPFYLGRRDE